MKPVPENWLPDAERAALVAMDPAGFHLRPPPPLSGLTDFITDDSKLFQVSHLGLADVRHEQWQLLIDGMVERPLILDWSSLQALPAVEVIAVHECFGSPLKPAIEPIVRVGNVVWRGVRLRDVLELAGIRSGVAYIWSEGLDHGQFDQYRTDRYQKDLPLAKALSDEVLLAYAMNGQPLDKARGGPVRLVVPGFFGTNSTKWVCRLSAQASRASGPFTTLLYNEPGMRDGRQIVEPVWDLTPHAFFTSPPDGARVAAGKVMLSGWAWAGEPIVQLDISLDQGASWLAAKLKPRQQHEWQGFVRECDLLPGTITLMCRATDARGLAQPLDGRRNQVERITLEVVPGA